MQKKAFWIATLLTVVMMVMLWKPTEKSTVPDTERGEEADAEMQELYGPADQFYLQRSFPDGSFDLAGYEQALRMATSAMKTTSTSNVQTTPWRLEGPTNVGGRINAVAVDPNNPNVILEGGAAGGIFKSTDGGSSWTAVFDDQAYLAIGDIVYQPGSSQILYAGTGDPNIGGYPFIGNGIYKSTDGGDTWTHLGLDSTRTTARIVIDPTNPNKIYVATMGLPMQRNQHRGLYKTTDGGATWTQSLFVSNQAGVSDVQMDPNNSQVLYASSWDRIRTNQESTVYGPNAKVWKTTNAGSTWTQLTNGLPNFPCSRVNLAIHPTTSNIVYAAYVDTTFMLHNIFRTTDGGASWNPLDISTLDPSALGGFGWYFGNIFLNPFNPNDLYLCGIELWHTTDLGTTWQSADPSYYTHADKHDMAFLGPSSYLLGTDGGLFRTTDLGNLWSDADEIPNSQIYRVAVDPHNPGQYAGGFQDNGTNVGGASAVNAWMGVYWADGFQPLYDNNPLHMVAGSQNGGLAYMDDGNYNWTDFTMGIDFMDRRSWDEPIIISHHNNDTYYTGTYRLYRNSTGLAAHNWLPISTDLTDGVVFAPRFHVITAIDESPLSAQILYVGTSDGNVQRTTNGGLTWANVSAGLPKRYVTSVKASPTALNDVFVTTSGYKYNDYLPHVFHSTDNGSTWTDISGDLPPLALNDILIHPTVPGLYVVASDGGVFVTTNFGANWLRVGTGMPVVPVYDMEWDVPGHRLIAGTHARSMLSFPMDSLVAPVVVDVNEPASAPSLTIFPNPATEWLDLRTSLGNARWEISDVHGRMMTQGPVNGTAARIAVGTLARGTYFLRVVGEIETRTMRFQKQ